jgi:2-polyprenyl-3-methyl-5-hydroxy-6-metoxy-1,4-benzoquinol methylase
MAPLNDEKRVQDARQYWNEAASSFDEEPDHGLHDPIILAAWTGFLRALLPDKKSTVLDIGCGTGSLSVVLAGLGHTVTGIDVSPSMISLAREKAETSGLLIDFQVMDAAAPQLSGEHFDAIVCRHLLWTLPEPRKALQNWAGLLKQRGRLILIEGHWGTGAGLHADEITEILPASFRSWTHRNLSDTSTFWGKPVRDERYAIIADKGQ